jgi:Virulence factor membrane-bound polymerase, C-terminal/O-Antigen ligase/Protein glycosylation ligase
VLQLAVLTGAVLPNGLVEQKASDKLCRPIYSSAQVPAIFTFTAALLLILTWLNPFAPGPSPAVAPWLFSMVIAAAVVLIFVFRSVAEAEFQYTLRFESTKAFARSLLIAGCISSALALLQYFNIEAVLAPWVNPTEPGYAFANLRQRNQFASLTNLALAVLLVWAMRAKVAAHRKGLAVAVLAAAALLAVGNAASASRTGVVQIVLLCALFVLWGGWRRRLVQMILLVAAVAYAVAAIALPYAAGFDWLEHGLFARLQAGDAPCASRITLWSNVLHLIAQKPWLGWGWGELDYAHFIMLYDGPRFCDILDNAHNLPLHLAVELGVPIAVVVCAGFAWWVLCQKPWAERDASRQLAWAVLAVILLHSLLEYPLWYGPFQIAFMWCIYTLWQKDSATFKFISKSRFTQLIWAQAAIISIAFILYAEWDYTRVSQIYLLPEQRLPAYQEDTVLKMGSSWLFADQAQFAELLLTPVTPATAAWVFEAAERTLHYSPEPRVAEKAIESAVMLGRDDKALAYLAAYRAAFPAEHARWAAGNLKVNAQQN